MHSPQPTWARKSLGFKREVSIPMWKRVINGFGKSDWKDSQLVIWTGKNSVREDIQVLNDYIDAFGNGSGKNILIIPSTDEKIFSPQILKNSTHFITSREIISLECMDLLWNTDVKVVSSLDNGIFDDEPDVQWTEIYDY